MRHANRTRRARTAGFTLLELMVVIFLIGLIAAISFPQFAPVIAFSGLEREANHLAGYGRSAYARALFKRERHVVRIDLDNQEYYTVHWVIPETEEDALDPEAAGDEDQWSRLMTMQRGGLSSSDLGKLLRGEGTESVRSLSDLDGEFDPELADQQMADRFDNFVRRATEERAKNVVHEEGFLDEVDIFDDEDEFDLDEVEPVEEVVEEPTLEPVRLEDAWIESVYIDEVEHRSGVVEVEITPLGYLTETVFLVVNDDGDEYTVIWDPLTGESESHEGRPDW